MQNRRLGAGLFTRRVSAMRINQRPEVNRASSGEAGGNQGAEDANGRWVWGEAIWVEVSWPGYYCITDKRQKQKWSRTLQSFNSATLRRPVFLDFSQGLAVYAGLRLGGLPVGEYRFRRRRIRTSRILRL